MFKIGDFSQMSRVSIRMLRHYDELGLLKPTSVEPFTGYRYYSANQLSRLHRIQVLKEMGLTLEQIRPLLEADFSPQHLRSLLTVKSLELRQQVQDLQDRLTRVEVWLTQFADDGSLPAYDVLLKQVVSCNLLEGQTTLSDWDTREATVSLIYQHMHIYCEQHGVKASGPALTIYYDGAYRTHDIRMGAALSIAGSCPSSERFNYRILPAQEVVSVIHHGNCETIAPAYTTLLHWIEAHAYRISGPAREVNLLYEKGATALSDLTEVQIPVEKQDQRGMR
jgi:DNA-binding transcriptional MerR regulator